MTTVKSLRTVRPVSNDIDEHRAFAISGNEMTVNIITEYRHKVDNAWRLSS